MNRPVLLIVLALLGLPVFACIHPAPVWAAGVEDCMSQNIDSCDFSGFDTMCQKLYSNPQPCDKLCKSFLSGTDVGTCVICCEEVMPQLNMNQPKQIELD